MTLSSSTSQNLCLHHHILTTDAVCDLVGLLGIVCDTTLWYTDSI
jgi:hypothetical protein